MTAILKVDTIQDTSGNNIINESSDTITIGAAGDTVTVPGTEVKSNKLSPASGTALQIGDSGDTITIPSGATIANSGTATGFGGGKVLQVVFGSTSTETRNSTNNLADTNLSASITPSATNSKVLIIVMQNGCDKTNANAGNQMIIKLLRGSTQISTLTNNGGYSNSSIPLSFGTVGGCLLDEPNSTSSLTYKTQFSCGNNTAGVGVQGTGGENSHITLMEIGA
jgi:hypothetical protein